MVILGAAQYIYSVLLVLLGAAWLQGCWVGGRKACNLRLERITAKYVRPTDS